MNVKVLSSISNCNKEKIEDFFDNHLVTFLKSYGTMTIEDGMRFGLVHPDKIRSFMVCNFVKSKSLQSDKSIRQIQIRAAAHYKLSLRTVQNMWRVYLVYERNIKK